MARSSSTSKTRIRDGVNAKGVLRPFHKGGVARQDAAAETTWLTVVRSQGSLHDPEGRHGLGGIDLSGLDGRPAPDRIARQVHVNQLRG